MEKLFNRIYWVNDTVPAINQTNLNSMSKAIDDIDDRVIELGGAVLETIPELAEYLSEADTLVDSLENIAQHPAYIGQNGHWYVFDTTTEAYVDSGTDATPSITIADVTALQPNQSPYVTNTGTASDPIFHLYIPKGEKGDPGSSAGSDWSNITNKPFEYVNTGGGLTVSGGYLQADVRSVSIRQYRSSSSGFDQLWVNNGSAAYKIAGTEYLVQQVTLYTIQTTVTFTDSIITSDSAVDIYADIDGVEYESYTISNGSVSIIFPPQASVIYPKIKIYVK